MTQAAASCYNYYNYVACNVYVAAGSEPGHRAILLNLLRQTQQACRRQRRTTTITTTDPSDGDVGDGRRTIRKVVGIVHAFADQVYNRSSIHLVGVADSVSTVAANLAVHAVQSLRDFTPQQHQNKTTTKTTTTTSNKNNQLVHHHHHHPYVGFVDHVAVMPIDGTDSLPDTTSSCDGNHVFTPHNPSGQAARFIGQMLSEKTGVQVYYYGSAHPEGIPLATVRRQKTNFFRSGGLTTKLPQQQPHAHDDNANTTANDDATAKTEVATVGAPLTFVENYNIRLSRDCSKRTAQSLTKRIRERDGGLTGVEALTLPYSNGRWEVACNLLQPSVSSTIHMDEMVQRWQAQQQQAQAQALDGAIVETCYRVGTTAEQCRRAIVEYDEAQWSQHDRDVERCLLEYLGAVDNDATAF